MPVWLDLIMAVSLWAVIVSQSNYAVGSIVAAQYLLTMLLSRRAG